MAFDFAHPPERRGSDSVKWGRYAGRDVLPLWVADMDFAAPPAVLAALHRRVDHGVFGYGDVPDSLVDVVVESLARDHAWHVDPQWIVWLPGLVTGLNVVCRAVGEPGDAVLTATPIYPPFLSAPRLSARDVITVDLVNVDNRWQWDLARLEAAITPRTRLLMLCNPHNPVGRAFSRAELAGIAEIAERHDLIICSDEIHCGLVLDDRTQHVPIAALGGNVADRCVTLMAPSKTWNIPGLGCSFAIVGNPALRRRLHEAMRGIVPHVNVLGFAATEAAYREGGAWREALLAYLRGNARCVFDAVARMPGLSSWPVEATYLAWIDARGLGVEHPIRFFEQAGVGLSDGADFGAPGFVRLNFGCSRSTLEDALARMGRAIGNS
ncbi:MAG: PatB family C-S lyase [Rhodocyclaceae bacterium]|nr:PatB family C-S lyase [Rhodocyclaceae bacterium]HMV54498.1 PatB family C-S lyase [Rhodocyclaceae bacterium]